ncbi:MAG: 4Fe-4S dicluster domain-containing protein [Bacteroidales bacterium]
METKIKIIREDSLEKLYTGLAAARKIYAPVVSADKQVEFRYNPVYRDVTFDHVRSTLSVKNIVFPKTETLFTFTNSKTESNITDIDISLIPEVVLWGSHPCDNAAFEILKSIFCWDITDKFFSARLEKLTVIGLGCHKSDEYCFCTSVGSGPGSVRGSDLFLTPLKDGSFKAEFITPKGNELLEQFGELFSEPANNDLLLADVPVRFSHDQVTGKLANNFENPFWVENSLRCIGCGACAYVCPTCACFDIQDETRGKEGIRYRSWDSCGFGLFTLHTSGHNPRHVQSQRWRQRIMHKFSYMPDRNLTLGCVGCGRCSSGCPVDMNIAEQLEAIQNL